MNRLDIAPAHHEPALHRLASLVSLDDSAKLLLQRALRRPRTVAPRRDLMIEGEEIHEGLLLVKGWAARFRQLADGRRQVLSLLLPGDLIGMCDQDRPLANSTVIAITAVDVCVAPSKGHSPRLDEAYARSRALDEAHLLSQVTRLGRLNAQERMVDLLLELLERLQLAGLAIDGRYALPLTQELLADMLGLTSVHINRTLQSMRRADDIIWKGRELIIRNPAALYRQVGRVSPRVSAAEAELN